MKRIPKLSTVARRAWQRPFKNGLPIFRHIITIYVDTFERSANKVMSTVQSALDEHTHTIQPDGAVDFEDATAVAVQDIERFARRKGPKS